MKHLKYFLAPCAALTLLSISAHAQAFAYEGFDIPAGELDGMAGDTSYGWGSSTWSSNSGGTPVHGVSSNGLSFGSLEVTGGALIVENDANFEIATTRALPSTYSYASTGQLWMSALIQPEVSGDTSGGGFFQLLLSDGSINSIYAGNGWAGTDFSAGGERVDATLTSGVPIASGTTNYVVMHLDFDQKTLDYWVNPDPAATDPGASIGTANMNTDLFLNSVAFWVGNYGSSQGQAGADFMGTLIDEVRLGSTWDAVSPVPEPATTASLIGGLVLLATFIRRRRKG